MKKVRRFGMVAAATVLAGAGTDVAAQVSYSVTEIPAYPGGAFVPRDMNDSGTIVGSTNFLPGGFHPRATVWSQLTGFTLLPPLGGALYTEGNAINNVGQVAGSSYSGLGGVRAVRWESNGNVQPMNELGPASYGFGINSAGSVVGETYGEPSNQYHSGFFWTQGGGFHGMGDNGYDAWGEDVNASGIAVGTRVPPEYHYAGQGPDSRAFVWDFAGGMRDIPLPAGERTFGYAINGHGRVVGQAQNDAFVSDPALGILLLQTGGSGAAFAVNEAGVVVGSGAIGPFIWDIAHGARPLNSLIATPITADHVSAIAINNVGQILVAAENNSGNPAPDRYFILNPIPSPASTLVLVLWLAGRRRRK